MLWVESVFAVHLLVILHLYSCHSQFVQPGLCDMHCHCPAGEAVVDCNRQDRLQGVPTNIPRAVTKLYVQDGDFPSPSFLTRVNMTGLEQIEYLSIIYCNLQAIESKTFLGMNKLKHLDLSRNALRRIDTFTFFGLQLINLYLQQQHNLTDFGLHIAEDAFDGLTADQINLRGNKLSAIHYAIFSKVNSLHRLILSDNRITKIDEGFARHFHGPSYLLDLTNNPLECSCDLAWIASVSVDWANSLPGLNMTCIYYYVDPYDRTLLDNHVVLELRRLTAAHLCPRSRIQHIEVSVLDKATRIILDCTAVTIPKIPYPGYQDLSSELSVPSLLSRTPPEVAWQYVEGGHLREVRRLSTEDETSSHRTSSSDLSRFSSTVRLNVSLGVDPRQFKCTTRNNFKESEEVIVTVRGPPQFTASAVEQKSHEVSPIDANSDKTKMTAVDNTKFQNSDLINEELHYMLQPQFSLVQLSLAVGGTFLTTLIFLFLGARCLSTYHRHRLLRSPSSTSSINAQDTKVVFHAGAASHLKNTSPEKSDTLLKQNGTAFAPRDQNQSLLLQQQPVLPHPYHQLFLSGMENRTALSPQLANLAGLNPFFSSPQMPLSQTSSSSMTDELQPSLAQLVSSPLLQSNSMLRPILTKDAALSPCLTNLRSGQTQVTYWPTGAPGSPYSVAGSHEYDVPRFIEVPSYNLSMSTNVVNNRSSLINPIDEFHGNNGVGTAL